MIESFDEYSSELLRPHYIYLSLGGNRTIVSKTGTEVINYSWKLYETLKENFRAFVVRSGFVNL